MTVIEDKEFGKIVFDRQGELEEILGIQATPYDASRTCGLRFYQGDWDLNDHDRWPEYIAWQLDAAVKLRSAVREIDSQS